MRNLSNYGFHLMVSACARIITIEILEHDKYQIEWLELVQGVSYISLPFGNPRKEKIIPILIKKI